MLIDPTNLSLFTERDIVLGANNKTHIFRIGGPDGIVLPLQPICEMRMGHNWVLTEVSGSALNEKLSGTQVKENMGRSDAIITLTGFFMSTAPTLTQSVGLPGVRGEEENQHWADKLKQIEKLFKQETSLPIDDWAPAEEAYVENFVYDAFTSDKDPFSAEMRDMGKSMFGELDIAHVVLLSFNLGEIVGAERKAYTLRLQQDRVVSLEELMPTEEGQE